MTEVKWIKLMTDIFDNKKIKKIRRMPEGNNIFIIWVYLLSKAGETNRGGGIFLTETIPYSDQDISDDLDFNIDVVRLAIITLSKFSMIEVFDDILYIKNWEEYQNIEGLDKIREQTRLRVSKHRQKKRIESGNVTRSVTVTSDNATEEDKELELEEDKEEDKEEDIKNNKKNKYKDVFDYYITLDLIKHKKYTNQMTDAIKKAEKNLKIDIDEMKRMLNRHNQKVQQSKNTDYPTKARTLSEFFGQKKYQSTDLICSDYLDERYENEPITRESKLAKIKAQIREQQN